MTKFKCVSCGNEAEAEAAPECCGAPMQEVTEAPAEPVAESTEEVAEQPAKESTEESSETPTEEEPKQE